MNRILPALRFILVIAGLLPGLRPAVAQVMMPLPPHNNVYTSTVRGYWFTAPTNFTITGLRVSPEAGTTAQYIHVFKINDAVPVVFSTSSTNFTTLAYISGAPNGVLQTVNIPVASGDKIGILGAVGTTTSNSYSPSTPAPQTSTINGMPVQLGRLLYQGAITSGPAPNYSTEPSSGSISRVEMWYNVGPPCDSPLNVTASNITHQSATLSWSNPPSPNTVANYQYALTNSATPPATGTPINGNSYATGPTLTPLTTYYFHVRSACDTGEPFSKWVTRSFTTLLNNGCFPPSALTINGLHPHGVVVNWQPVMDATSYEWEMGLDPNPPATIYYSSAGTQLGRQDLSPNTTYYVHVRTRCGANRVSQTWATESFTTPDGPPLTVGTLSPGFLTAFPNPAGETLTLVTAGNPAADARVVIRDMAGRVVTNMPVSAKETGVKLGGVAPGMYFLHYSDANGSAVMRIQKQ